jgi:hypothetical protein
MIESILTALLQQGPFGIITALCLVALWRKDKQVEALYKRLEEKSEKMTRKYEQLGGELNLTIQALVDALEREDK